MDRRRALELVRALAADVPRETLPALPLPPTVAAVPGVDLVIREFQWPDALEATIEFTPTTATLRAGEGLDEWMDRCCQDALDGEGGDPEVFVAAVALAVYDAIQPVSVIVSAKRGRWYAEARR